MKNFPVHFSDLIQPNSLNRPNSSIPLVHCFPKHGLAIRTLHTIIGTERLVKVHQIM